MNGLTGGPYAVQLEVRASDSPGRVAQQPKPVGRRLVNFVQTAAMSERSRWIVADAMVQVSGEEWTRTESLRTAGPNDAVFEVDTASGRVSFGDGAHGARPPEDAAIRVKFAQGGGNRSILPLSVGRSAVPPTSDQSLWVTIHHRTNAVEFSTDEADVDDGAWRRPALPARACWLVAVAACAAGWFLGGRCSGDNRLGRSPQPGSGLG